MTNTPSSPTQEVERAASHPPRANCANCYFGTTIPAREFRDCPGHIAKQAHVICRRYPRSTEKGTLDWCGEWRTLHLGGENVTE